MKKSLPFIGILTLIITIIAIIIPLVYDYIKNMYRIDIILNSQSIIIEEKANLKDKIKIFYQNTEVKNILQYNFSIHNTGKKPIVKDEVFQWPNIKIHNSTILDISIIKHQPSNMLVNFDIKNDNVEIQFELLNPSDYINFQILVAKDDLTINNIDYSARIKNIKKLNFINKDFVDNNEKMKKKSKKGIIFYIAIISFIIFVYVFISLLLSFLKKRIAIDKLSKDNNYLHKLRDNNFLSIQLNTDLNFLSSSEKKKLQTSLTNINSENSKGFSHFDEILIDIIYQSSTLSSAIIALIILLGLSLYIFYKLFA